ncbi:MAG: NnrS family protein [Bdellovibrionaceae bacterium]|nr:NnrS family protein [Pseudobdellovibrionaceae bacterium]
MNQPHPEKISGFFHHAIWLVGFRPFFTLAFLSGALLPLIWGFVYVSGRGSASFASSPLIWHSHEMLYGFGWAVLAGFLLTASKNWLKIRGLHGGPLALAVALWCLERLIMAGAFSASAWSPWIRYLLVSGSVFYVVGYVVYCLVKYRKQDSFQDNYFFVLALPVLLLAKAWLLDPETYAQGWALSLGIFRVAFAVMFERTMTQFMKNAEGVQLFRNVWLDTSIKALVLLSAFEAQWPGTVGAVFLLSAASLLLVRFFLWSPLAGFRRLEIAVMYVGYLALTMHLLLMGLRPWIATAFVGSIAVHVFTFLCMGVVIPAMLIRISQGHTGRTLVFTFSDRVAFGLMFLASFLRLIATQLWPAHYAQWIALSGVGWALCFMIIGFRLVPFLWAPRADGRLH